MLSQESRKSVTKRLFSAGLGTKGLLQQDCFPSSTSQGSPAHNFPCSPVLSPSSQLVRADTRALLQKRLFLRTSRQRGVQRGDRAWQSACTVLQHRPHVQALKERPRGSTAGMQSQCRDEGRRFQGDKRAWTGVKVRGQRCVFGLGAL